MKILANAAVFPSRIVTNKDIAADVLRRSPHLRGNAGEKIVRLLASTGAYTRRVLGLNETTLALTALACETALAQLNGVVLVDCIIYAGLFSEELAEPASAPLLAHEIGMDNVRAYDIRMACDGWMIAASMADEKIYSGRYKCIMIVCGEYPMEPCNGIYPELFALNSLDDLEHRFPGLTLGSAVTATIIGCGGERWKFRENIRNDLYDLCTITVPGRQQTNAKSPRVARSGFGVFTSYGGDLFKNGLPAAIRTFKELDVDVATIKKLFTHSSSKRDWEIGAKTAGLDGKLYDIYHRYGNCVTASIPAAMALAEQEGELCRGDRIALCTASAGMSFSAATFTY